MINLHESMGPGWVGTGLDPWICSQTWVCCQTCYQLRYAARYFMINLNESMGPAGIKFAIPGSAVRLAFVARHVTDCATRKISDLTRDIFHLSVRLFVHQFGSMTFGRNDIWLNATFGRYDLPRLRHLTKHKNLL